LLIIGFPTPLLNRSGEGGYYRGNIPPLNCTDTTKTKKSQLYKIFRKEKEKWAAEKSGGGREKSL